MFSQKICIIGNGLAGLSTAMCLSQENIIIDLYCQKNTSSTKNDKRTTAISESNYLFLKKELKLNISKYFWPIKKINLYYQDNKVFSNFLNFSDNKKNLMYIFLNNLFKKDLFNSINKKKNINLIYKTISAIDYDKGNIISVNKSIHYDLIILCLGNESKLYKKIEEGRSIKKNYKEIAITATVKTNKTINNASQYFLDEGPLAILPFNRNYFSLVWSVKNTLFQKNENIFKKKLYSKLKDILKNKTKIYIQNLQSFPIHLNLKTRYYKKNILILGDGLHSIHPMAGQGFNLVVRDIKALANLLRENSRLGMSIEGSFILDKFYKNRNPENTIISLGVDLTNYFFKKEKFSLPFKKMILQNINKSLLLKKISRIISDKGILN